MEPIEQQVLERVAGVAGLSVLLLFGSRGRMDSRPDSDLDVAVLGTAEAAGGLARHRLHKSLSVALADLAPEGRVDVVFLDEAPDTLRQRIVQVEYLSDTRPLSW